MFKRCLTVITAICISGIMNSPIVCNTTDHIIAETNSETTLKVIELSEQIETFIPSTDTTEESKYSETDIEMIASVVMHEVGYCSEESKIAVTHLILNRVESDLFPNTVYEVLHQKGQFTAIHNYYDKEIPVDEETSKIVRKAIEDGSTHNAVFYYAPKYTYCEKTADWFESLDFQFEIEGQRYFR